MILRKIFFPVLFILVSSCSTFKPIQYNEQSKRYNNYEFNYTVEALDGYSLLPLELSEKIANVQFPDTDGNISVFYNKQKDIYFFIIALLGDINIKSPSKKQEMFTAFEKKFEHFYTACIECVDHSIIKTEDSITVEAESTNQLGDQKAIISILLEPMTYVSSHHRVIMLSASSKPNNFEEAQRDFMTMSNSFKTPAFFEWERKVR